jgi:RimJ/RimL family protein N-acetyltransferase
LLDSGDDTALDQLLAFAETVGRPRAATARAYRELIGHDVVAAQSFVAHDGAGVIRAAAQATVSPGIGLDQVQLNGFLEAGADAEFAAVLDAVGTWATTRAAIAITAHVIEPDDVQIDAWISAGFAVVGERARVVRRLADDEQLDPGRIDGASIFELRDRPDLEAGAESLWRQAHRDVPSALRFDSADLESLRSALGLEADDGFPTLVLVAATPAGAVVGLAVAVRRYAGDPSRVGHRMTATSGDWRGRGVARALKRELLRRGSELGVCTFEASNDSGNAPMHAINERLGYEHAYRLVLLRRDL